MCLLLYKPAGIAIPRNVIEEALWINNDGFGMCWRTLEHERPWLHVHKIDKPTRDHCARMLDRVEAFEALIHFRLRTHGPCDARNAHPYQVAPGLFLAHNGVLDWYGKHAAAHESDTAALIRLYLNPTLTARRELLLKPKWRKHLGRHIGYGNKLVIADAASGFHIINESEGAWDGKVWFSDPRYNLTGTSRSSMGWLSTGEDSLSAYNTYYHDNVRPIRQSGPMLDDDDAYMDEQGRLVRWTRNERGAWIRQEIQVPEHEIPVDVGMDQDKLRKFALGWLQRKRGTV